jgi:hypothetical protein
MAHLPPVCYHFTDIRPHTPTRPRPNPRRIAALGWGHRRRCAIYPPFKQRVAGSIAARLMRIPSSRRPSRSSQGGVGRACVPVRYVIRTPMRACTTPASKMRRSSSRSRSALGAGSSEALRPGRARTIWTVSSPLPEDHRPRAKGERRRFAAGICDQARARIGAGPLGGRWGCLDRRASSRSSAGSCRTRCDTR